MDALANMFKAAFALKGRTTRYDFWYFFAFLMLLGLVTVMLSALVGINFRSMGLSIPQFVIAIYSLIVFVGLLFAGTRRLRDAHIPTVWIALMFLGPIGWLILIRLWILPTSRRKPAAIMGE